MIRFKFEKFKDTFVFGVALSKYKNKNNFRNTSLIFDLGQHAFAIIVGRK